MFPRCCCSGSPLPAIRALDYDDTLRRILVGTNNCDVLEVTETSAVRRHSRNTLTPWQLASCTHKLLERLSASVPAVVLKTPL